MPWDISFHIMGEQFRPSQMTFAFTEAQDPGEEGVLGRYRGTPIPYGWAIIRVPSNIPNQDRIEYLHAAVLPLLPELAQAGATDWTLDIGRYYSTQCNEELTADQLTLIAQLRCSLTYSAYQVTEVEELELERKLETFGLEHQQPG